MSRFIEFKYDEKQWELRVEEKLDEHYKLMKVECY